MSEWSKRKPQLRGKPLSVREHQVLLAMARGLADVDIAAELGVAQNTVKTTSMRMFAKLGVHARAEAVAHGCHGGLIPAPAGSAPMLRPAPPAPKPAPAPPRIPGGLLDEAVAVLRNVASGYSGPALSRQAGITLQSLRAYIPKPSTVPAQRTRDSRP